MYFNFYEVQEVLKSRAFFLLEAACMIIIMCCYYILNSRIRVSFMAFVCYYRLSILNQVQLGYCTFNILGGVIGWGALR